jgi:hypothetical protein
MIYNNIIYWLLFIAVIVFVICMSACELKTIIPIVAIKPKVDVVGIMGQTGILFKIVNYNGIPITVCVDVLMYPSAEHRMVRKYVLFDVFTVSGDEDIQSIYLKTKEKILKVEIKVLNVFFNSTCKN